MPSEITPGAPALVAPSASENRINERRDCRAVRQNQQSPEQRHHQNDRHEHEFASCADELPKLSENRQHRRSSLTHSLLRQDGVERLRQKLRKITDGNRNRK